MLLMLLQRWKSQQIVRNLTPIYQMLFGWLLSLLWRVQIETGSTGLPRMPQVHFQANTLRPF